MSSVQRPQTIEELLLFCQEKNMPLRTMRFFIGEDYPEPKAFGIFRDADGDFVVYKNKADGSRAIRYKGPDEARAVGEIYDKLHSEIMQRKQGSGIRRSQDYVSTEPRQRKPFTVRSLLSPSNIMLVLLIVIAVFICVRESNNPSRGYYRHGGSRYYYDSDEWYYYDDGAWVIADVLDWMEDDYDDYYVSNDYYDGFGANDFRLSPYYDGYYERSNDDYYDDDYDDDDWDYDFGDWDTGGTDWDTDW